MAKKKFRGWSKMNAPARKTVHPDQPPTEQNRARQQAEPFSDKSAAPISEAKLQANRSNAQLSTGATSETGKAIVSQNATKQGLTGDFRVLRNESQADYDRLLAGFLRAEAPSATRRSRWFIS